MVQLTLSPAIMLGGLPACAQIERGRYAVSSLELQGMEQMHPGPLRDCLLTRERAAVTLRLGAFAPRCSEPPFTSAPPELKLWTWGWTDWPTFNRSVFDQDLERILRWYRARGFYDAEAREVSFDPPSAGQASPCRKRPCEVKVAVTIHEGRAVSVETIEVDGIERLPEDNQKRIRGAAVLVVGSRFDEIDYDASKRAMLRVLHELSFAAARIQGRVEIDRPAQRARVRFEIEAGRRYTFGTVRVAGNGRLPQAPILLAADLESGEPYHPERAEEIRVEVLALRAFSAVDVLEKPDEARGVIDVTLKVTPLPTDELRLGVGVTSGASHRTETGDLQSVPQWDVHLFARYERRHIAGTLGALRIEENPRLIFSDVFPNPTDPGFGNVVTLKVNQPGLIEARTDLFAETTWDYGPDPFLGFTRSDLTLRIGARRGFFARRLLGTLALQQDVFVVPDREGNTTSDGSPTPSSYNYAFIEQDLRLDLRNQSVQPSGGAYFAINGTESVRSGLSDWSSVRVAPDARFYLAMPFSSVLAFRFAIGALIIFDAEPSLDDLSRRLGPSSYRLRGGGANSVRGFLPGELGAGSQGGLRRWESMLEWRIRLGSDLTAVGFLDAGDVNDADDFRFDHLNTSAGFGVRYFTLIGPLRVDAGFRIVDWQRADGSSGIEEGASTFPLTDLPGALHLTIGDSF